MRVFKKQIASSFDKGCSSYDSYSKLQQKVLKELLYFFLDELSDNKNQKTVLELGCGTGESYNILSKKLCLKKIHLLDISKKMIEKSKEKISDTRANFYQKDFDTLKDFGGFDLILSNMSIHWSGDILKLFKRIVNTINKDSFHVISFPNSKSFNNLEKHQRNFINNFPVTSDLIEILDNKKFLFKLQEKIHSQKFKNFFELLKNLKLTGTNVSNREIQDPKKIFNVRKYKNTVTASFNISYLFLKKIEN